MRRPFRVRLSVRLLMALVLLAASGLGWVVNRAHVQRDAVAAIVRGGGTVLYDWDVTYVPGQPYGDDYRLTINGKPKWPKWLIDHLGPDYFAVSARPDSTDRLLLAIPFRNGRARCRCK